MRALALSFIITAFMVKKRLIAATLASAALVVPFFPVAAQTAPAASVHANWGRGGFMGKAGMRGRPGMMAGRPIFGSVTAVSGSTLTVASKGFGKDATATTYTVDATNAKVDKNGAAGTISDIAVGDMVMIQGAVNGASVTATAIRDGMPRRDGRDPAQDAVPGNGQPVVMGTVSAIAGSTLTITNNGGTPYTVDATSATILKAGKTAGFSDIAVGDVIVAQGTVNGTSITAASVRDQGAPKAPPSPSGNAGTSVPTRHAGFFGRIGGWFTHLFGF